MSNTTIPQLSSYQYGLLSTIGAAQVPIFLLPRPTKADNNQRLAFLRKCADEIVQLIGMGLVEEASEEFKESIDDHRRRTGRRYKVFGFTEMGYLLFGNAGERSVN